MNLSALLAALPWAKRVWKVLPPQGRIIVLLFAVVASVIYALKSNQELGQLRERVQEVAGSD